MVKNWGFQFGFGEPVCVYCFCGNGSPFSCTNELIQADIYDWLNVETEDNCPYCNNIGNKQNCPTADWVDKDTCHPGLEIGGYPARTASDRFIRLARKDYKAFWGSSSPKEKFYEGVRSTMTQDVQGWTDYVLRIKMAAEASDVGNTRSMRVTFSKYGDHWYRKKGNVTLDAGHFTIPANTPHQWYTFEQKFSTSLHNQMKQIIVIRDKGDDGGFLFLDNVELYAYCPDLMPIQNRTFDSTDLYDINFNPLPMEGKMVHSGDSVTSSLPQGNVICDSLSRVNFKGEWEVKLQSGTQIKRGAVFRAYISPCGVVCPIPSAYVIDDTSMCANDVEPIYIGGLSEVGVEYTWTAEPNVALTFLSNAAIANPLFTPPTIGSGNIRYTLKATSPCGTEQTRYVTISYDNNPSNTPNFVLDSLFKRDSIQFKLTQLDPQTEKVLVQILSCDATDTIEQYVFDNNIDFTCCNFQFKYNDYLNPCNCYKVRVATKNYCFDTWKDTMFTHTRDSSFNFDILTNVGHKNQADICYRLKGVTFIELDFINRWDQVLQHFSATVEDSVMCFTVPNKPSGSYRIIGKVKDCNGVEHDFDYIFSVFDFVKNPNSTRIDKANTPPSEVFETASPIEQHTDDLNIECLIFPNPTTGTLHFAYNTIAESTSIDIAIFDALGRKILTFTDKKDSEGIQENIIDVSSLADGIYFVKIQLGTFEKMERLIINRQ